MTRAWRSLPLFLIATLFWIGCDEDEPDRSGPSCIEAACAAQTLPLDGQPDGPTVVDVTLECQPHAVVLLATATDPQGSDDLIGVVQSASLFPNGDCSGTPIVLQDDLAGSGLEESFGDAVLASTDQLLYDTICACESWPVEIDFVDTEGNATTGIVRARVVD